MHIRSFSWGAASISWSTVVEELLHAAEEQGHRVVFLSTNGHAGMKYWDQDKSIKAELYQREFIRAGGSYDIDLTYTVPINFKDRFLSASKCKMAIYAYESSIMPQHWAAHYHLVDYVLPPSRYCAEMFRRNGCPDHKIKTVPHGVDLKVFNPEIAPLPLNTEKQYKFLCVGEPHYRKQIDKLLSVYCENFTAQDDVSFILKTKIFESAEDYASRKNFEMDLKPVLASLKKKHGAMMPEIKVIPRRLKNIAALYRACDTFVLMTASEGWCVPYLEALAMGLQVIAPRHGGQLEYLNDHNSILTACGTRRALPQEQYWGGTPKATVGAPDERAYGAAMRSAYEARDIVLKDRSAGVTNRRANALETAQKYSWSGAMDQILHIAQEHIQGRENDQSRSIAI